MSESLSIQPISLPVLPAVLELDNLCFGKLWTLEAYQRELDSPNSELLGLFVEDKGAEEQGRRGAGEQSKIQNFPTLYTLHPTPASIAPLTTHQAPRTRHHAPRTTHHAPLTTHHAPLLAMGCFWAILDEAHITLLAVHPDYQGRGLGQAMLWGLMAVARDRTLSRATLEVRASNQAAISLYNKFGFQLAGRRRRYYKDTNEDALILWRSGLQHPEFQVELANWHQLASDRLRQSGLFFNAQQLQIVRPE